MEKKFSQSGQMLESKNESKKIKRRKEGCTDLLRQADRQGM